MDFAAARAVRQLVTSLTTDASSSSSGSLDAAQLAALKAALRSSEELVDYAAPLIMDRLAANNAQTRALAVELCAVLFRRSRIFRQLLTQQFTSFVELSIGFRPDKPLPGPGTAAQALRSRALEVIEDWHEAWGQHYPEVTAAYRFLKKQYKFPAISTRAAAAAAEAAARRQRHQQQLLQRYDAFRVHEYSQQRSGLDLVVRQLQACLELLQQQPQEQPLEQQEAPQPGSQAAGESRGAEGASTAAHQQEEEQEEEQQWEEVQQQDGPATAAAAAAAAGDFDDDELVGDLQDDASARSTADQELAARNASLLDQLADLARQAHLATTKPLLDWLRLLSTVQPLDEAPARPGQQQREQQQRQQRQQQREREQQLWQQERQRLLREVVQLRAQLQALVQEAAEWGVVVPAGQQGAATPAVEPTGAASRDNGDAAAAGGKTHEAGGSMADLAGLPSRAPPAGAPQQQQPPTNQLLVGSRLQRLQQQRAAAAAAAGPYAKLRDPTAAAGAYVIPREVILRNERLKLFNTPPAGGGDGAAAAAAAGGGGGDGAAAGDPERQQQERGASATTQQGLKAEVFGKLLALAPRLPISGEDWMLAEYSVNQQQSLGQSHWGPADVRSMPRDRLGQLVGLAASFYTPQQQQQQRAAPAGSRGLPPLPAAATAAAGAGNPPAPAPPTAQVTGDRAAASAHNRAALAGAFTDEGLAAALQQQLDGEGEAGGEGQKKRRTKASPESKGAVVRRKLLG